MTTKTDRELLELAAKAAGIACDKDGPYVERQEWQQWFGEQGHFETVRVNWNPLHDDGDALRLAVKLNMELLRSQRNDPRPWVSAVIRNTTIHGAEDIGDDANAATRRAIVRAAAAIGEAMP